MDKTVCINELMSQFRIFSDTYDFDFGYLQIMRFAFSMLIKLDGTFIDESLKSIS